MALLFDQNQGSFQDTGSQNSPVKKNTGIMRKEMSKLDSVAPRGHALAYITPEEAQVLNKGGGGVAQDGNQMMGPNGIPMYPGYDHRQRKTSFTPSSNSSGPPGRNYSSGIGAAINDRSTGNNNKQQKKTKQERPKDMPSMLSYTPPKKKFNTDEFMETVGNSIGGNKDTINQGLLVDPNLNKTIEDKEKGNGILDRKGDVSNNIIEFLKTNIPETKKEQDELLFVVDKFPMLVKNNIKKAVDNNEISLLADTKLPNNLPPSILTKSNKNKYSFGDLIFDGLTFISPIRTAAAGAFLGGTHRTSLHQQLSNFGSTPSGDIPSLMKPSGTLFNNLQGTGNLADELASVEGFYGGSQGVRGAIRHAVGASYGAQGSNYRKNIAKIKIPKLMYPEIATDKDLDLWYAKSGPNYNAIDDRYTYTNFGLAPVDFSDFADTINNRVGVDNLSNLPFEERYEKVKQMTIEQLEHFIETDGEFKKGLPVWNSSAERREGNTFYEDGIINNVEDAKEQLKVLKEAEENLIDQRRMGLLRQTPEASNMEQLASVGRNERYTYTLNVKNRLTEDVKNFKENNKDNLYETKPVKVRKGLAVKNMPTEQAKNLQTELERLENRLERYIDRNQNTIDSRGLLKRNAEEWFDKAMEEQNFLKAGNDWTLKY